MRRPDWPERLVAVLDRVAGEPFEWGRSDCFTLAMDVVEALTGTDPWAAERGAYTSPVGARRRLEKNGFASLDAFAASLGREVAPAFAGRGDLAVATTDDGAGGLVVSDGLAWVGRDHFAGLVRLPRAAVARAIKID
jgi:hypothetical protein